MMEGHKLPVDYRIILNIFKHFVLQLIKSLKLKIQKLNEMLQDAKEEYRKIVEEDSTLKQMVRLKVGHISVQYVFGAIC